MSGEGDGIPSKAADDDHEKGEVVATAVVGDQNERDDGNLVEATVVADGSPPNVSPPKPPASLSVTVGGDLISSIKTNMTDYDEDDDEDDDVDNGETLEDVKPSIKSEGSDQPVDAVQETPREETTEAAAATIIAASSFTPADSSETALSTAGSKQRGVSTEKTNKVEVNPSSPSRTASDEKNHDEPPLPPPASPITKDEPAYEENKEDNAAAADDTTTTKETIPSSTEAVNKFTIKATESAEEGEIEEGKVEDMPMKDSPEKPSVKEEDTKNDDSGTVENSEVAEAAATTTTTIAAEKMTAEADKPQEVEKVEETKEKETPSDSMDLDEEETPAKETETTTSVSTGTEDVKKDEPKHDEGEVEAEVKEDPEEIMKEDTETADEDDTKDDTEEDGEIKEDVEMEDAMSQSEEGGDRDRDIDTASNDADTASVDGDADSVVDDRDVKKVENSYSTRGRSSGTVTPVPRDSTASGKGSGLATGIADQWARSLREAVEDLGRSGKDAPPAGVGPGGSFLEALGEEERRTRTRFLPAVDGIHQLRKNEVKGDLALARSIMSNAGNVTSVASVAGTGSGSISSKKSKSKRKHDPALGEADAMDTDDGNLSTASEDDPSSDGATRVSSAIEVEEGNLLMVPSAAFVPPPAATHGTTTSASNGEKKEEGTHAAPVPSAGVKGILNNQRNIKSPKVVESVTAFNPPRPPESVGKKKQHRMLRWERRPTDVEVDLNNYRKTVDRTRKELHAAEDELERIEQTSNHLRRNFMNHLHCMDLESEQVVNELNSVQQECVSVADLLTSRTRSRGAGKGSYVMRDVLTVLKQRGAEITEKGLSLCTDNLDSNDVKQTFSGIGGVSAQSFADWSEKTVIKPQPIASSWVLPDDKVDTPYGEGVVVKVFSKTSLNVEEPPLDATQLGASSNGQSPSKMDVDSPAKKISSSSAKSKSGSSNSKANPSAFNSLEMSKLLGPRICVRLPFGIAYFSPAAVTSKASPNMMSDAQLTKRWRGLIETAVAHAGQLDIAGMISPEDFDVSEANDNTDEDGAASDGGKASMDIDDKAGDVGALVHAATRKVKDQLEAKLLPFASGLLPTGTGRGDMLTDMEPSQLQKELKPALSDGCGVLGDPANEGTTLQVKEFEAYRQATYTLQAQVLQLRNQLFRQTRIRTLNERTLAATSERSSRVESLVAEMRTDLKSLKGRLDEELKELGIDHEKAEEILGAFYLSQQNDQHEDSGEGEASKTSKRSREATGNGTKTANPGVSPGTDMERQSKRTKVASQ